MVLSAVTHSLVIGCKMRQEDPTADTSMVTRPPHHTYTIRMHSGGRAAADTDPEVAVNFTNISIQQPTDSDSTVTNSPSFSIGQCVNVGMHWLGCVAVYLSLKTCRDDLFV